MTGKTFVYMMLYAIFSLFLLGLIPLIFDLPDIGNVWNIIMLLIPFLMATSFFGLAASVFFTDSFVDDRLFLRRIDFPFRCILSFGTDALVLEIIAFPDPGCPGNPGVCQIEFDGSFYG